MSLRAQFWRRLILVGVGVLILNPLVDVLLGIPISSGRDWLIFFTLYLMGLYFFVWRWQRKTGYNGGEE